MWCNLTSFVSINMSKTIYGSSFKTCLKPIMDLFQNYWIVTRSFFNAKIDLVVSQAYPPLWKLPVLCTYLTGQSCLYAFGTMIFVVNGKKKSGIEYPNAYLLQGGGRFFLGTPPLVRGLPKIEWVLKLNAFLLFITNLEVSKCIKLLP